MKLNLIAFAVPFFLLFMLLEFLVARKKKMNVFKLQNSISNISIGIAERLLDMLVVGAFYWVYDYTQKNFGLFTIKPGALLWLLLFLCTDFIWYWYHRLAHEISIFWAAHVVHHQSDDFNYTVSARITVFQAVIRTGFWCVLPFIGFPAGMITSVLLVHGLYPFFIHTQTIGKLGILEYIFVTPSHHRVHHASNEKYLDKNYGDVFIIWDKIFGTFQKEEEGEKITYGLTTPLHTYSFLWQHFHFLAELAITLKRTKGIRNKLRIAFGKPDLVPEDAKIRAKEFFGMNKNTNVQQERRLNYYVIVQVSVLMAGSFLILLLEHHLSVWLQFLSIALVLLSLINCGAVMEQKQWVFHLEYARLLLTGCILLYLFPNPLLAFAIGFAAVSVAAWYESLRKMYVRKLFV